MAWQGELGVPQELRADSTLSAESISAQISLVHGKCRELLSRLDFDDPSHWNLVLKAFLYAWGKHHGQMRDDGQPYVMHPLEVALLVSDFYHTSERDGYEVITTALLHDVVEDCGVSFDEIEREFGQTVAFQVEGLTKVARVAAEESKAGTTRQSLNFEKLLRTLEDDIRIMVVKLFDRLHNMRTLGGRSALKQRETASQTRYFYIPLAEYLGLYNLKAELENLCFPYLEPKFFEEISQELEVIRPALEESLRQFAEPYEALLRGEGIDCRVTYRVKSLYSIGKKMQEKQVPLREVYDVLAMRIVFDPIPEIPEHVQCWYVYTVVSEGREVETNRIRDWVTSPKETTGYEALHCTVKTPEGYWVEVQIRTTRMHENAEYGAPSHRRYKGAYVSTIDRSMHYNLLPPRLPDGGDTMTVVEDTFQSLVTRKVFVYREEGGAPLELEQNHTALDFALAYLGEAGRRVIGVRVNGEMQALDYRLQGGERVGFIYSRKPRLTPEMESMVNGAQSKAIINAACRQELERNVKLGRDYVLGLLGSREFNAKDCWVLRQVSESLSVNLPAERDFSPLFQLVAEGNINRRMLDKLVHRYLRAASTKHFEEEPSHEEQAVEIRDFVQCSCCHALPGDDVIFHALGHGRVEVHLSRCQSAIRNEAHGMVRMLQQHWASNSTRRYRAPVAISGEDRKLLLSSLFARVNDTIDTNIVRVDLRSNGKYFRGYVVLELSSKQEVERVIGILKKEKGVHVAIRLDRELRTDSGGLE